MIIIISYSTSSLSMNYAHRFLFHVFAPILLFSLYLSATDDAKESYGELYVSRSENGVSLLGISVRTLINSGLFAYVVFFGVISTSISGAAHLVAYYPRAIDSHAALGKALNKISLSEGISSFSFGDAGMAAYHSELIALDNIGLGSRAVTSRGIDFDLLDQYSLDMIVFHAAPSGIRFDSHRQNAIYDWGLANNFE